MESEERSNSGSPFDFRNMQSTDPLPTDSFYQAARPLSFRRAAPVAPHPSPSKIIYPSSAYKLIGAKNVNPIAKNGTKYFLNSIGAGQTFIRLHSGQVIFPCFAPNSVKSFGLPRLRVIITQSWRDDGRLVIR